MSNGGDRITGNIGDEGRSNAVGKDIHQQQVSIYSDTYSWRQFVRHDLDELGRTTERQGWQIVFLLSAIMIIFVLCAIVTGLVIRQFDQTNLNIERMNTRIERRIEQVEDKIPTPTPYWPQAWPEDRQEQLPGD